MPAAAERVPRGFSGPVAYDDRWLWLAVAAVALVAGYYLVVLRLTRERGDAADDAPPAVAGSSDARRAHLERIDRVAAAVAAGATSAREGHQRLSGIVRSYVGEVSDLPAPTMTLADLRARADRRPELVEAIELMYPPEFAPEGEGRARELFDEALRRSRELVTSWT